MATYEVRIEGGGLHLQRQVLTEQVRRIMHIVWTDEHDRAEQAAQDSCGQPPEERK